MRYRASYLKIGWHRWVLTLRQPSLSVHCRLRVIVGLHRSYDLPTLSADRGVWLIGPTVLDGAAIPNRLDWSDCFGGPPNRTFERGLKKYAAATVLGLRVPHLRFGGRPSHRLGCAFWARSVRPTVGRTPRISVGRKRCNSDLQPGVVVVDRMVRCSMAWTPVASVPTLSLVASTRWLRRRGKMGRSASVGMGSGWLRVV